MERFNSFQPLIDRSAAFDANKHDSTVAAKELSFSLDGELCISQGFGSLALTLEDSALGQLGERLGRYFWKAPKRTLPTDFYRQLYGEFPQHFAPLTNELLEDMEGKLLIRGYEDKVRAILSEKYVTLDNSQMLDMANQVLEGVDFDIVESGKYYAKNDGVQRDDMTVRVMVKNVMPPGESGPYGLGVMIRNGETGGGASEVRPLIMRTSCMNSIVFRMGEDGTQLGLKLGHIGSKQAKLNLFASAIAEALPMAEAGLNRFLQSKEVKIDLTKVIGKLGEDYGWGEEVKTSIAVGTEGSSTAYGFINGLTYAAHELELNSYDRFNMEALASKFIYEPSILTRASAHIAR